MHKGVFMLKDEERLKELEKQIDRIIRDYAEDYLSITKQKGYDEYSRRWQKKTEKVAEKYVKFLIPLKNEYNDLCDKLDQKEEEERKKKYI